MKTINRIINNIKWLFNHPPTSITSLTPDGSKCEFCERTDYLEVDDYITICRSCRSMVYRKVLK